MARKISQLWDFLGNVVTGVGNGIAASDAVNKSQLDLKQDSLGLLSANVVEKLLIVNRVATSNIATLSGVPTIDSALMSDGQLVLLAAQTTASQNGVYVVSTGAWTRYSGFDSESEIVRTTITCDGGSTLKNTYWICTNTGTITVGTTSLTFLRFYQVATTSQPGSASFSSTNFAVSAAGAVTVPTGTTSVGIAPNQLRYLTTAPTTAGMIPYIGSSTQFTGLAIGASGTVLKSTGTIPSWSTLAIADVTNLQTTLDGKAAASHTHVIADVTNLQTTLDGKASTTHTHVIADVTNLQTTLDGKASSSHTHTISDISGLQASLDSKAGKIQADFDPPDSAYSGNTNYEYTITVTGALPGAAVIINPNPSLYNAIKTAGSNFDAIGYVSSTDTVIIRIRTSSYVAIGSSDRIRITVV